MQWKQQLVRSWKKRRNKYGISHDSRSKALRTYDGIEFASLTEMARYRDHLKPLLSLGHIDEFEFQPRFDLQFGGYYFGFYTADFFYREKMTGQYIVEEIKGGVIERDFPLRWKIAQMLNPKLSFILLKGRQRGRFYSFQSVKMVPKKIPDKKPGKNR
jgi:hypothetical protein